VVTVQEIAMGIGGAPIDLQFTLTRDELVQKIGPIVKRSFPVCDEVFRLAGLSTSQIDEVVLVGGTTRIPHVREVMTQYFGKTPRTDVNPDEAVAIGAALYAFSLQDDTNLKLQLLDVIPMAIGLEKADGKMHQVFPRNSPIPNAKQITGTTSVDNQSELIMRIYQGDHDEAKRNEQLGEFTFAGIRQARAGQVRVEITFDVSVEGILTMRSRDPDTGKELKTTVRVTQS
jgi:molecular chaperone DnaK